MHIEQSAAGEWIKAQRWDCIADELQTATFCNTILFITVYVCHGGDGFKQWGVLLGKTANLVWEKGFFDSDQGE